MHNVDASTVTVRLGRLSLRRSSIVLRASGALFLVFVSVFFAFAAATDYVLTTSLSLAFYLAAGLVAHRLWGHALATTKRPLSLRAP